MTAVMMFKLLSGALALMALICGGMAAWRSYQAANVPVDPGWALPGEPGPAQPGTFELQQMAWTSATLTALQKSSGFARASVGWTIAAVVLGSAASLASLFPL